MIYFILSFYILLALLISSTIRKIFKNVVLKRFFYAIFLSLFLTFWFLHPGSKDLAPVLSIYFINILESESILQMRLIRPLILVFMLILIFDFILFRNKAKKK